MTIYENMTKMWGVEAYDFYEEDCVWEWYENYLLSPSKELLGMVIEGKGFQEGLEFLVSNELIPNGLELFESIERQLRTPEELKFFNKYTTKPKPFTSMKIPKDSSYITDGKIIITSRYTI